MRRIERPKSPSSDEDLGAKDNVAGRLRLAMALELQGVDPWKPAKRAGFWSFHWVLLRGVMKLGLTHQISLCRWTKIVKVET